MAILRDHADWSGSVSRDPRGLVGRAVVDHDHLVARIEILIGERLERSANGVGGVERRDDDADLCDPAIKPAPEASGSDGREVRLPSGPR